MEIRRASLQDAATLSRLNAGVQRLHAQALPDRFKAPESDDFALSFMREKLSSPLNYFFIARLDGEDIGYVFAHLFDRQEDTFTFTWRVLYIDQIGVAPARRRKGCGRALVERVRQLAREAGIDTVALDT